jgi:hypothetical protein
MQASPAISIERGGGSLFIAGWVNAEALMPARVCAYMEAAYTLFCDTLTKRSNDKHRDYPLPSQLPPPLAPPVTSSNYPLTGSRCA